MSTMRRLMIQQTSIPTSLILGLGVDIYCKMEISPGKKTISRSTDSNSSDPGNHQGLQSKYPALYFENYHACRIGGIDSSCPIWDCDAGPYDLGTVVTNIADVTLLDSGRQNVQVIKTGIEHPTSSCYITWSSTSIEITDSDGSSSMYLIKITFNQSDNTDGGSTPVPPTDDQEQNDPIFECDFNDELLTQYSWASWNSVPMVDTIDADLHLSVLTAGSAELYWFNYNGQFPVGTHSHTIGAMIKFTGTTDNATVAPIFSWGTIPWDNTVTALAVNPADPTQLMYRDWGFNSLVYSPLPLNTWAVVFGTYNSTTKTMTLYVGTYPTFTLSEISTKNDVVFNIGNGDTSGTCGIGTWWAGDEWIGLMRAVIVYNRELQLNELQSIANRWANIKE